MTTTTTTSKKKLKVLCLHSFRTSADIMKIQLAMGGWDKHVEDSTEFMCIDGIFPATGEPPEDVKLAFPNRGSFQWYDADRNAETGKMEYKGIVESAKFVDEIVKREGIDGLLGFSQGATLIGEMLKRSSESAGDDIEGSQEEAMRMKSLRFAVLICDSYAARHAQRKKKKENIPRVSTILDPQNLPQRRSYKCLHLRHDEKVYRIDETFAKDR